MWWGEEISQSALPPAPDPSRSQRRTLGATRAHTHTRTHSHPLPSRSTARPPSRLHTNTSVPWKEVRREHGLLKGAAFLFPVDTSQDTQVYCSKPPRNPGLAQTLEFSSRCQVRMPAGPPPCGVGLYCACWAPGPSSRPGGIRGSSQVV